MKLAFIGFGVVGQGLAQILHEKKSRLAQAYSFEAQIVAISDLMKGSLYHPDGLDIPTLLKTVEETGRLDAYPRSRGLVRGLDSLQTIRQTNADTIVEVSYTDLRSGQPAIDHCRAAFSAGKHLITTNKGPVALAYHELSALARRQGVYFGIEGTVMSGTPTMRLGLDALRGCEVYEVRGIFNGTTNYILTQMEDGKSYSEALEEAQALGYAEANPTNDVEGHDTMGKVVILANTLMGASLTPSEVSCQGITSLTLEDIRAARQANQHWKLIGMVRREAERVVASVQPICLPASDPLAAVRGATNAITFKTDLLGAVTLVGPGAGREATGFALLADLMNIRR